MPFLHPSPCIVFFLPATLAQYMICQRPYPRVIFVGCQICWKTERTRLRLIVPDHAGPQFSSVRHRSHRVPCREGPQQNQHSCVCTLSHSMRPIAIPNPLLWLRTPDASSFGAEVEAAVTQTTAIIQAAPEGRRILAHASAASVRIVVFCLDSSGGPHFIRHIINNAVIIPSYGFDSVPTEASVCVANETSMSVLRLSVYAYNFDAGFSGSEVISIIPWFKDPSSSPPYESMKRCSFREFSDVSRYSGAENQRTT